MRLALAIASLVVLAFPATALAGGWATVEVAPPPAGIGPGDTWRATLVVKQHGITPVDDARPSLLIHDGRGEARRFFAEHAGRPGTYVADVTFPAKGTWTTRVFDGWTDATPHRLAPIVVPTTGDATPTAGDARANPVPLPAPDVSRVVASSGGFPAEKAVAVGFMALIWLGLVIAVVGLPRVAVRRTRLTEA
jgi:hypothetical protein